MVVNSELPPSWERRKRTLHIVDIENLVGQSHELGDVLGFQYALAEYAEFAGMSSQDPVMLGCHPGLLFTAQTALGSRGQIFTGHGDNGADLALLEAANADFIASRFHLVSLGSGDHIFVPLVQALMARHVLVRVVARRGRTSADLQDIATAYVTMPELADDHAAGAAG